MDELLWILTLDLTELLMEKDILDRSFARFGYAGLDKCIHWLLLVD